MEYCYRASTEYDEKAYHALAYLMIHRLRKWPRIMLIATGMATTVVSAVIMLYTGRLSILGMALVFFGSLMSVFGIFARHFCVKMMMASGRKGETPKNTYLFFQEHLRIQNAEAHKDYAYGDIRRVVEMSGYFFLFMADGQLYLLKLEDVKGSLKNFRAFLEERLSQSRQAKG